MRVLVIDDEESAQDLMSAAMIRLGYDVWIASSGKEAIDLSNIKDFDLIFCDEVMGKISGFEVLRHCRETLRSQAEIVLMSDQASVEAATDAVQRGATDYIVKPFSI